MRRSQILPVLLGSPRTSRLATLLALPLLVTACAAESDPLDDLAPYDQQTGGGKFDDPNCTDVTFRAFIKDYRAGTQPAEGNPCVSGNDASYRIWAYVVGTELEPTLTAYDALATKRFTDRNVTADQLAEAGTLSAAQREMLAKLDKVKPAHAGRVGYAAWAEYVGKVGIPLATRIIGTNSTLPDSIVQPTREITTYEDEWLNVIASAQPLPTEAGTFNQWYALIQPDLDQARRPSPTAADTAWLARLPAMAPAAVFDGDGSFFHETITQAAAATVFTPSANSTTWQPALALVPHAGGRASYGKWVTAFVSLAETWNAGPRNDAQRGLLAAITAVKPCASGTDVDEVVGRATTALRAAGNGPTGTPFSDVAKPVACAAP